MEVVICWGGAWSATFRFKSLFLSWWLMRRLLSIWFTFWFSWFIFWVVSFVQRVYWLTKSYRVFRRWPCAVFNLIGHVAAWQSYLWGTVFIVSSSQASTRTRSVLLDAVCFASSAEGTVLLEPIGGYWWEWVFRWGFCYPFGNVLPWRRADNWPSGVLIIFLWVRVHV